MTREQTIENKMYGTGWHTCHKCGLTSKDVRAFKTKPAKCRNKKRCELASSNQSLGGKVWNSKGPNDE